MALILPALISAYIDLKSKQDLRLLHISHRSGNSDSLGSFHFSNLFRPVTFPHQKSYQADNGSLLYVCASFVNRYRGNLCRVKLFGEQIFSSNFICKSLGRNRWKFFALSSLNLWHYTRDGIEHKVWTGFNRALLSRRFYSTLLRTCSMGNKISARTSKKPFPCCTKVRKKRNQMSRVVYAC
jgi:hypothetical protein